MCTKKKSQDTKTITVKQDVCMEFQPSIGRRQPRRINCAKHTKINEAIRIEIKM